MEVPVCGATFVCNGHVTTARSVCHGRAVGSIHQPALLFYRTMQAERCCWLLATSSAARKTARTRALVLVLVLLALLVVVFVVMLMSMLVVLLAAFVTMSLDRMCESSSNVSFTAQC